jgi:hypothetical protein
VSQRRPGVSAAPAGSVFDMRCPAAREVGCLLRAAATDAARGRNGMKESLTECEIDVFLSLARGRLIAVRDHETGALCRGLVDLTSPDRGFLWIITDCGERKLLDTAVHTLWRPTRRDHAPAPAGNRHWSARREPALARGCASMHASAHLNHAHLRRAGFRSVRRLMLPGAKGPSRTLLAWYFCRIGAARGSAQSRWGPRQLWDTNRRYVHKEA